MPLLMLGREALLGARGIAAYRECWLGWAQPVDQLCRDAGRLTQLVEARRLASELRVQFTKAAETGNRAVMASAEDSASAAANESRQATEAVAMESHLAKSSTRVAGLRRGTSLAGGVRLPVFRSIEGLTTSCYPWRWRTPTSKHKRCRLARQLDAANAFKSLTRKSSESTQRPPADAASSRWRPGLSRRSWRSASCKRHTSRKPMTRR